MAAWRKTSGFGPRNTGIVGASTNHPGIDGVGKPANLILVHEGKLVQKWWNDYRGWACLFDIGEGYKVLYQHKKQECPLSVGTLYPAGQIVGIMGDSRNKKVIPKMGAHLHFEVYLNGKTVDPEPYINNLEEYEMIEKMEVKVDGKVKTVERILKNGRNFTPLRDIEDVFDIADVDYDAEAKMPIITRRPTRS